MNQNIFMETGLRIIIYASKKKKFKNKKYGNLIMVLKFGK